MSLDGFWKRFSWIPHSVPDVSIDALYTSKEIPTIPRILTTAPSYMAYLKISEGCDHVCTFCAIPGFRGRFRSRPITDLVAESQRLADQGVRELVIVSQDTMAYGKDIGLQTASRPYCGQLAESRRAEVGPVFVLLSEHGFR